MWADKPLESTETVNTIKYWNRTFTCVPVFQSYWVHIGLNNVDRLSPLIHRPPCSYGDVMTWKHFPRHWSFMSGIHGSPVDTPHRRASNTELWFLVVILLNITRIACKPRRMIPMWRISNAEVNYVVYKPSRVVELHFLTNRIDAEMLCKD